MRYLAFISLFLLSSCSSNKKLPQKTEVTNYASEGTAVQKIVGNQELEVEKNAEIVKGFMSGPRTQEGIKYNASACTFSYEKGTGQMNETSPEFKFETISLNVTGFDDSEEETTFERISYSNVDFKELYKDWNFTGSFGPVPLDNSAKYGNNTKEATLEFIKKGEGASMIFRHAWIFEGGESSFFKEGEMRKYVTVLNFAKFNSKEMLLNNANIKIFNGDEESEQLDMNVDCLNFKKAE